MRKEIYNKTLEIPRSFDSVSIGLMSPEEIVDQLSNGEVESPETILTRSGKPVPKGLFCERIFGPVEDYKCACGKYSNVRYSKTEPCGECGVLIAPRSLRRQRFGHIHLVVPIVHPLYFRYYPNVIGALLGIHKKKLENIIYYSSYIVFQPGLSAEEGIQPMDIINTKEYEKILDNYYPKKSSLPPKDKPSLSDSEKFIAKTGGEAIRKALRNVNLEKLAKKLRHDIVHETSQQRRGEARKRLLIVQALLLSRLRGVVNNLVWMVPQDVLVPPPDYRPIVKLPNGRPATSDATSLYKLLIVRNQRLSKLISVGAPPLIIRNEMRMVQEAAEFIFDRSRASLRNVREGRPPLQSISDKLQGKKGLLRGALLGKRVDFSGRTVITVGPTLKLFECGVPKEMALVLFEPFVLQQLRIRGIAKKYPDGKKIVEQREPIVWKILDQVTRNHPVLLNRAPTLHRLGIQAFFPRLIEGKSIQLHPLVCVSFNADFDGDTMSIHVPLGEEAIAECIELMLASKNLLNPSNGQPIMGPTKDIVLGIYYLTQGKNSTPENPIRGEGKCFSDIDEVLLAINNGKLDKHACIKVLVINPEGKRKLIDTVAGRVIFNQYVPKEVAFVNKTMDSACLHELVVEVHKKTGMARTAQFLDDIKQLGFHETYVNGLTYGLDDIPFIKDKKPKIAEAKEKVKVIENNYTMGFMTQNERYNQIIDVWTKVSVELTHVLKEFFSKHKQGFNTLSLMMLSGARGSYDQAKQSFVMRGLMSKAQKNIEDKGSIIEQPILSSFAEGLNVFEYYISTFGSRKALSDTTLKTANAGYFSRRLVDLVQGSTIIIADCKTSRGRTVSLKYSKGKLKMKLAQQVKGRVTACRILDPKTREIIVPQNVVITEEIAQRIDELGIKFVKIRSPLYCEGSHGVCMQCYGINLGEQRMAVLGDVIGILAAQSISEPGTQLTLRTFHSGGAVAGSVTEDVIKTPESGRVMLLHCETLETKTGTIVINREAELHVISEKNDEEIVNLIIPYGAALLVQDRAKIKKGQALFEWNPYKIPILTTVAGKVSFLDIEEGVTYKEEYNVQTGYKEKMVIDDRGKQKVPYVVVHDGKGNSFPYLLPSKAQLIVKEGDNVEGGDILAQISRPKNKPQDIVGGLPRVIKLLEMQKPLNSACVSSIDGYVSFHGQKRGSFIVKVTAKNGVEVNYKVPVHRQLLVQEGDYIRHMTLISDGLLVAADVLAIQGLDAYFNYMIDKIQYVYLLQGVTIDDKHLEVVLREMTRKVEVVDAGDTRLVPLQIVDKNVFKQVNEELKKKKIVVHPGDTPFSEGDLVTLYRLELENKKTASREGQPAEVAPPRLAVCKLKAQGITSAASTGPSFLAAASFQETMKTLLLAAIEGKADPLKGIKENAMLGRLFPAGTGHPLYRSLRVGKKEKVIAVPEKDKKTVDVS